jgi:hypothetical protein
MIVDDRTFGAGSPQRILIDSRRDVAACAAALVAHARRTVRCADRDLAVFGLSDPAAVEAIERLLLGHRDARVRLLVDEADWLERSAARLRGLQRRFAHALELRVASPEDPVGEDALVLADDRHVLSLRRSAHALGEAWLHNPPHAQPLVSGFDRRWEAAGHNLPVVPLGL